MTTDIFKLFANSIEQVAVKKTKRGTFTDDVVYSHTLDAIVKRRDSMAEAVQDGEDRNTQTTIHFRASDSQYIEEGNFVQIDGKWRVLELNKDGKDFAKGASQFIKAYLGNQIEDAGNDPIWS